MLAGASVVEKSQWIIDVFGYAAMNDIKLEIWYNEDKETDWAVFGGNDDSTFKCDRMSCKAYKDYKAAVSSPNFVSSVPGNARLITDRQFWGQ